MSGRDWGKELYIGSSSTDMVRSWFVLIIVALVALIAGFVTMFYAISFLGPLFGVGVGCLFAVSVMFFVHDYLTRIKRDFGKFGIALQLFFSGPHAIGMWIPNKMFAEKSGMQIAKEGDGH